MLKAADPAAKLTTAPDETIDGKPQSVIKLRSPFGVDVALYLDKKTKLLTRMAFTEGGGANTDDFGDYKDVGGIKFAHKRNSQAADGRSTKLDLKSVEIDPKYDQKMFDKPPAP